MAKELLKMKFQVGDIVFAKMKGWPTWPAIVRELNGNSVRVDFVCPEKNW